MPLQHREYKANPQVHDIHNFLMSQLQQVCCFWVALVLSLLKLALLTFHGTMFFIGLSIQKMIQNSLHLMDFREPPQKWVVRTNTSHKFTSNIYFLNKFFLKDAERQKYILRYHSLFSKRRGQQQETGYMMNINFQSNTDIDNSNFTAFPLCFIFPEVLSKISTIQHQQWHFTVWWD